MTTPLDSHPGYFIDPSGQVYSKLSGELRPVKLRQTSRGRVYVHIYDASGRRQHIGVRKLLIDTFPGEVS